MTAVGKLLVFLNLVFSLVVGAFAVMDYTARTHWSDQYNKLSANYAVSEGTARAYKAEAEKLAKEKTELNAMLMAQARADLKIEKPEDNDKVAKLMVNMLGERAKTINDLKGDLNRLTTQLIEERAKLAKYGATSEVAVKDIERRQADVAKLRDQLATETKRNNDLVKEVITERDEKVAHKIDAAALRSRNEELLRDVARLEAKTRTLEALARAGGTGKAGLPRALGPTVPPPPSDVEGLVQKAEGNLVTISIGGDSGIAKGQELQVFRFGTNPKYLGKIRIMEVTPNQAVGQAVGRTSAPMQKGDRVAPRILAGGN